MIFLDLESIYMVVKGHNVTSLKFRQLLPKKHVPLIYILHISKSVFLGITGNSYINSSPLAPQPSTANDARHHRFAVLPSVVVESYSKVGLDYWSTLDCWILRIMMHWHIFGKRSMNNVRGKRIWHSLRWYICRGKRCSTVCYKP